MKLFVLPECSCSLQSLIVMLNEHYFVFALSNIKLNILNNTFSAAEKVDGRIWFTTTAQNLACTMLNHHRNAFYQVVDVSTVFPVIFLQWNLHLYNF